MEMYRTRKGFMRVKLIFNPGAGATRAVPVQLVDIIHEMQAWKLVPEVFLIEPDCDLPGMIKASLETGIRMFVVCGGDGTISSVVKILAGTNATLGIIPIGTQNNAALSLSIPDDIPAAIALLRTGRRIKIDVGQASCGEIQTPFLEVCSVGLVSSIFPAADDIQHGNLARVGDFLTTLAASPPSEIRLVLDNQEEIHKTGHVLLVCNMPFTGLHYRVSSTASLEDGLLDVLFFAELSKLELLNLVFQGIGAGMADDPRVLHFQVRQIDIDTSPAMQVMTDGYALGEGPVRIEARKEALAVMVG
jgi:diacylglycerol kinase (ATP)